MIHTIGSVAKPGALHPCIRKHILPDGYISLLSEIIPAIERSSLVVRYIEVLRLYYAETLKAWRQCFMAHRDEVAVLYDERFCQVWEFYHAVCEAEVSLDKNAETVPPANACLNPAGQPKKSLNSDVVG